METQTILELVGYLGSFLVIISMLMTSVVKLRIINTIGSVIFAIYAQLIHSYPTAAMQYCLIIINIVNLIKLLNIKKEYSVVKLNSQESFVQTFLSQNANDIKKFFPDFTMTKKVCEVYFIYSGNTSVGILLGEKNEDAASLNIHLDYTTPAYRDTSVAKFLFTYLQEQGISNFKVNAENLVPAHEKYLKKMGFVKTKDCYEKHSTGSN